MCERLSELRTAMGAFAGAFDPALLSVSDAARAVREAAGIEKAAAAVKGLAAARVADTEYWAARGHRSPAHALARESGTSVGQAAETIETGRRLPAHPATGRAARRGDLSPAQAAAITKAAAADPASEGRLLALAKESSLPELRDECARTEAAATDLEERHRQIHKGRYLRSYTDPEGAGNIRVRDTPDVIAQMMAVIEAERERVFNKARREGRQEPPEAYGVDALFDLLCGGGDGARRPAPTRPKIIVRVDLGALLRGYPVEGEVSELCGYGPVPCSVLEKMLETTDPFLAAVVTKGTAVVGVTHLGRRPTVHQQTALEWLYPTCAVTGCSSLARLQNDHREDWAMTRFTLFDLLDRLCPYHHRLKTVEGWSLVPGTGKRTFVPPTDRRHPKNANAPPGAT